MLLQKEKIKAVFKKVQQIKEHTVLYCLSRDNIPVSIVDLHWVIQDMYGLQIKMWEVSFAAEFTRGGVARFNDNKALILVKSGQAKELLRYVCTKELSHLVIDEKEDWSADVLETIENMIVEFTLAAQGNHKEADNEVQSEILAELAALEILYPHEFREADNAALAAGTTTIPKLALDYEIPEFAVSRALSATHMKLCKEIWGAL